MSRRPSLPSGWHLTWRPGPVAVLTNVHTGEEITALGDTKRLARKAAVAKFKAARL